MVGCAACARRLRVQAVQARQICLHQPRAFSRSCARAERWLEPGTEYADPALLKLDKAWYQGLGLSGAPDASPEGE